jgi:hypothetical protein
MGTLMAQKPPQPYKKRTRKPSATRLLKGVLEAGLPVRGIELDPAGTLRVLFEKADASDDERNEWDNVK